MEELLAEIDYLNQAEEDILQLMPDEMEMVDTLGLEPPNKDISTPQGNKSINTENIFEESDKIAEGENNEDSGQFFEQPERASEQDGTTINSTLFSNKKLLLVLAGLSLIVLLAISYIVTHDSGNSLTEIQKSLIH